MFEDREDAGRQLAEALEAYRDAGALVLAIPRGGVPVGYRLSEGLRADFDVLVSRKVPIPWEPEAGFGAVGPDGELALNNRMVAQLGLSRQEVKALTMEVLREVRRREKALRPGLPRPVVRDRTLILVDDGLATGFTMLAALKWARKSHPHELVVAVPCSSASALDTIESWADTIVSLEVSHRPFFAVASFYENWWDLTDEEVLRYLKEDPPKGYYHE